MGIVLDHCRGYSRGAAKKLARSLMTAVCPPCVAALSGGFGRVSLADGVTTTAISDGSSTHCNDGDGNGDGDGDSALIGIY